ncbi:MAG: multicopper oxidase domain-containing protein [Rhodococcus sp. (in: high G+C Gram-positive bacteria)]|nr:multicopper oxidase domain-containing protein [Rhodococcus sp. (in: high G+C Gram-positive bacteria)]MDX5452766.1 multicopper oxidase domain-containing protein [Rhodococcus sp. (in: high G+C Gram-positive bacteria)]
MCRPARRSSIDLVKRVLLQLSGALVAVIVVLTAIAGGLVAHAWNSAVVDTTGRVTFDRALRIPPLATSTIAPDGVRVFDLTMQRGTTDLGHGPGTRTWGVNGSYLGPTLRAGRGEQVRVNVTNELDEASTLHWHGMHLPAAVDGGPHQPIAPGATWSPQWTVDQPAATLWYHPHPHGTTADHVYRGIAGLFLLDDPAGGPPLPDRYGIDDIPLVVQDKRFDRDQLDTDEAMFAAVGLLGDEIVVNGTPRPYLDVTAERIRLRLLNASNSRVYNFSFDTGLPFLLVGTVGGPLTNQAPLRRIQLSPGERAEIVVALPAGATTVLRSTPPDLGADFWQTRFSGGDDEFDILELRAARTLTPSAQVQGEPVTHEDPGPPDVTRHLDLTGSGTIDGRETDMSRIDQTVAAGATEVWEVRNSSGTIHNFHVHGTSFRVLGDGHPALSGPKDTVYIAPGRTVRLLMRFTGHPDPATPYMYHCHLLRHEDDGMMGQFVVVDPGAAPPPEPPAHTAVHE